MKPKAVAAAAALAILCACSSPSGTPAPPAPSPTASPRILLFTRTKGFVHRSIPAAVAALKASLAGAGATVEDTNDPNRFTGAGLVSYAAVVFLLTTGDVLDDGQQKAFEEFIRGGRGFAGVHSAADTEYGWPWYHDLLGATFKRHPKQQEATMRIVDARHVSTATLPNPWMLNDEWYDFRAGLPAEAHVLVTVDESSYQGGTMGPTHAVTWCREWDGGRSWYTAMGHPDASWQDPLFVEHVTAGIMSVTGRGGCSGNE